jgi:hypothetical protein
LSVAFQSAPVIIFSSSQTLGKSGVTENHVFYSVVACLVCSESESGDDCGDCAETSEEGESPIVIFFARTFSNETIRAFL